MIRISIFQILNVTFLLSKNAATTSNPFVFLFKPEGESAMPKSVVEREIPNAGKLSK